MDTTSNHHTSGNFVYWIHKFSHKEIKMEWEILQFCSKHFCALTMQTVQDIEQEQQHDREYNNHKNEDRSCAMKHR